MNARPRHFTAKKSRCPAKADHEYVFEMRVSNFLVELGKEADTHRAKLIAKQLRKGEPVHPYDQEEQDALTERERAYTVAERESGLRQFTYSKPVPDWTAKDVDRVIAGVIRLLPPEIPAILPLDERRRDPSRRRETFDIGLKGPSHVQLNAPLQITVRTLSGWQAEIALPGELPPAALGGWLLHWKLRCATTYTLGMGRRVMQEELDARTSPLPSHVQAMRERMLNAVASKAIAYMKKNNARVKRVVARAMAKEPPPPTVTAF